jgi:hypothetical protein
VSTPQRVEDVDVLVAGGGLGGVAAACAAAEQGASVLLVEELPVLGGQLTAQMVPPDEHPHIEQGWAPRSYLELRRLLRARAGSTNPGDCWVSRLCVEPRVAAAVTADLLAPLVTAGRVRVRHGVTVDGLTVHGRRIVHARLSDGADITDVRPSVVVDATELGDLLPLAEVPWVIGSEGSEAFGEPHALPGPGDPAAEQSCTWVVALRRADQAAPVGDPPPGYATARDTQPFTLAIPDHDGRPQQFRMFTTGPDGSPPFWSYRRVRAPLTGQSAGCAEVSLINWAGNDFAGAGLVADRVAASTQARALTAAFVHWLRTEAPREDGGRGWPELVPDAEVGWDDEGFALAPYVRESRRLRIPTPITVHDLLPDGDTGLARVWADSVAIGWYHADLHARVGHPRGVYEPTAPFTIPARALVTPTVVNVLAGAKNLAATQVAAAATRVHPVEWAVGEAAGVIAGVAVARRRSPWDVAHQHVREAQMALLQRGAPLAWTMDVPPDDPAFADHQLRAVRPGGQHDLNSPPHPTLTPAMTEDQP